MNFNFNRETENNTNGFEIDETIVQEETELEIVPEKRSFNKDVIEWLEVIATAVIAVVVIFCFLFRVATIDGDSMLDTLHSEEKVIITNLAYTPKNGDIVVISRNVENSVESQITDQGPIIKRVIAVGGQTVNIDNNTKKVYVDGVELKEDYARTETMTQDPSVEFPLYVPEGYIFVLGDNRAESLDSRFSQIGENGLVDTRYVLGHAIFRIFPFNTIGRLDNK